MNSATKPLKGLINQYKSHRKKFDLTDESLFMSPEFRAFAEAFIIGILGYKCKLTIYFSKEDETVAYTDGESIVLNTGNDVAGKYEDLSEKALANIGIIAHECAHKLYLDFGAIKQVNYSLKNGHLFGSEPIAGELTPEEQTELEQMTAALANKDKREIFCYVYNEIDNIIADAHDEACICRDYGGIVPTSISHAAESLREQLPTYEEMIAKGRKPLTIIFQLILEMARYDEFFALDYEKASQSEYIKKLIDLSPHMTLARSEDDYYVRIKYINRCILILWTYIEEALKAAEKRQNTLSRREKSALQPSIEAIQEVMDQLKAGSKGISKIPVNQPLIKPSGKLKGQENKEPVMSKDNAKAIFESLASTAMDKQSQKMTEEALETTIENQVMTDINTVNQTSPHKGIPVRISRNKYISSYDIDMYNQIMDRMRPFSNQMKRKIGRVWEELREGSIEHHKAFGRSIEAKESFRRDGRFFAKKNRPQDLPDMAIAVLVDQSGSMSGDRLTAAMEATILLDDFATGLGIPIAITGHNTSYCKVGIFIHLYSLFDRAGKNDSYSIVQMRAGGNNRDGMALNIVVDMLLKRPEEIKLLIIISDGRPRDVGYGGDLAKKDIKEIVSKARVKGVQVFAAAIGDDKEQIQEIYGEGFLDVSDLSSLPKTMVRLISKRII